MSHCSREVGSHERIHCGIAGIVLFLGVGYGTVKEKLTYIKLMQENIEALEKALKE